MPLPAQIIHICTVAGLPDHDNTAVHIGGDARCPAGCITTAGDRHSGAVAACGIAGFMLAGPGAAVSRDIAW